MTDRDTTVEVEENPLSFFKNNTIEISAIYSATFLSANFAPQVVNYRREQNQNNFFTDLIESSLKTTEIAQR